MRTFRAIAAFAVLSVLAACGGGSGGSATPPPSSASVTITQQPVSVSVTAPTAAEFTVSARATSGTLHYAWTARAPGASAATSIGSDSPSLTVDPTQPAMSGTTITVSVSADADPVTSQPAMLTVHAEDSGGESTPVFMQSTGAEWPANLSSAYVTTYQFSFLKPVATGDTVKVALWNQGSTVAAISIGSMVDDAGNSYQMISQPPPGVIEDPAPPAGSSSQPQLYIYQAANVVGTPSTITFTPLERDASGTQSVPCNFSLCNSNWAAVAVEYSGSTGIVDSGTAETQGAVQPLAASGTFQLDSVIAHDTEVIFAVAQSNVCNGAPNGGQLLSGNGFVTRWISTSQDSPNDPGNPAAPVSRTSDCLVVEDAIVSGGVTPVFFYTSSENNGPGGNSFLGSAVATQ